MLALIGRIHENLAAPPPSQHAEPQAHHGNDESKASAAEHAETQAHNESKASATEHKGDSGAATNVTATEAEEKATAKPTVDVVSPDQSRVMSPQPSPESPMRPTDLTMPPRDLIPTLTAKQLATAAAERKPPRAFVLVMGAVRVGGGLACVGCGCDLMLWWLWLAAVRIVFEEREVGCRGGAVGVSDLC